MKPAETVSIKVKGKFKEKVKEIDPVRSNLAKNMIEKMMDKGTGYDMFKAVIMDND
jgi:hypothetical protein